MSGPDRIWAWRRIVRKTDGGTWSDHELPRSTEYIRRDTAVLAALPEVQAMIAEAVAGALDSVTTLHTVIADIRAATVGSKPMLSDLAQALVAWRDEAVAKEREACAMVAGDWQNETGTDIAASARICPHIAAAIRKRGEGKP